MEGSRGARWAASAGRAGRGVATRVRRAAAADGAGDSGLSALLGASALSAAGDALVGVALAGTVFFSVPLGEARDRVALYLLLTLLPFSLLVPVAGPVLDRFRHGRRNVLAATTAARGLLTWSMAGLTASLGLYPLALAVLVLSRSYGVARSAALPRVRPPGLDPVTANARLNVAVVLAGAVAGAVGAGVAALAGSPWVLRLASVVLLAAAVCAVRLPEQVDEARVPRSAVHAAGRYRLRDAPRVVRRALAAALALRALAGLLTIFLAFLLKAQAAPVLVLGAVLGCALGGQLVGTGLASRLPARATARLGSAALVLPALGCLLAALRPGSGTAALAAGVTGLSYALSKFGLDAALQAHVPSRCSGTAFARSETGLQLAWAVGGGVALALPTAAPAGFAAGAVLPVLGAVAVWRTARRPDPALRGGDGGRQDVGGADDGTAAPTGGSRRIDGWRPDDRGTDDGALDDRVTDAGAGDGRASDRRATDGWAAHDGAPDRGTDRLTDELPLGDRPWWVREPTERG